MTPHIRNNYIKFVAREKIKGLTGTSNPYCCNTSQLKGISFIENRIGSIINPKHASTSKKTFRTTLQNPLNPLALLPGE